MQVLGCGLGGKKKHPKFQIVEVFREGKVSLQQPRSELHDIDDFAQELSQPIVCYSRIQNLAWRGVPTCIRAKVWKLLLKYVLANDTDVILTKKRQEYQTLIGNYWNP